MDFYQALIRLKCLKVSSAYAKDRTLSSGTIASDVPSVSIPLLSMNCIIKNPFLIAAKPKM